VGVERGRLAEVAHAEDAAALRCLGGGDAARGQQNRDERDEAT